MAAASGVAPPAPSFALGSSGLWKQVWGWVRLQGMELHPKLGSALLGYAALGRGTMFGSFTGILRIFYIIS